MKDRGGTISPVVLLRFLRLLMCSVDIHEHPSKLFVKSMPREPFHPVSWYPTGGMKIKSAAWWRVQAIGLVLGLVKFLKSRVPSAHLSHLFFQVKCFPIWSIKDCCKLSLSFPPPSLSPVSFRVCRSRFSDFSRLACSRCSESRVRREVRKSGGKEGEGERGGNDCEISFQMVIPPT